MLRHLSQHVGELAPLGNPRSLLAMSTTGRGERRRADVLREFDHSGMGSPPIGQHQDRGRRNEARQLVVGRAGHDRQSTAAFVPIEPQAAAPSEPESHPPVVPKCHIHVERRVQDQFVDEIEVDTWTNRAEPDQRTTAAWHSTSCLRSLGTHDRWVRNHRCVPAPQ